MRKGHCYRKCINLEICVYALKIYTRIKANAYIVNKAFCVLLGIQQLRTVAKLHLALAVATLLLLYLLQDQTSPVVKRSTPKKDSFKCPLTERGVALSKFEPFSLDSLRYALEQFADTSKSIYVALVDSAFADVATNLYLTSFKRLNTTNYLFVAMNAECCDVLSSRGINCLHYIPEFKEGRNASVVNSKEFNIKTSFRAKIVLDSLKLCFSPFLIDLDIMFISNPLETVLPLADKYDLIVQDDIGHRWNTGFYFGKPTSKLFNFSRNAIRPV